MNKLKYHVSKNYPVDNGDFKLIEEGLQYEQKYKGRAYRKAVVVCDCGKERQAFVTEFGPVGRKTEKNVVCCPECAGRRGATPAPGLLMRRQEWRPDNVVRL